MTPAPCQQSVWAGITDDSPFIAAALAEWNLGQPAYTKPARNLGDLPASEQSKVVMRAAEIKLEAQG